MPIFFNDNELTPEQRARYNWAVVEYARIQDENKQRRAQAGLLAVVHEIGPQSALFARLLDGKAPLLYPPPTSFAYPWYDIVETPGRYHVTIGGKMSFSGIGNLDDIAVFEEHIILNQCPWGILRKNEAAATCFAFLQRDGNPLTATPTEIAAVRGALDAQPEFIVGYGRWGEFRLMLGRIIRRGRRDVIIHSSFDLHTLDGGNPLIVKILQAGVDIRAKSDATLANVRERLVRSQASLSALEHITMATESNIRRATVPEGDDLVEYDCDGWILERI
jgi:hypothetical protein